MLRLATPMGVLMRLSKLSMLARPSKERGVAVQLLEWSTSALKSVGRPSGGFPDTAEAPHTIQSRTHRQSQHQRCS